MLANAARAGRRRAAGRPGSNEANLFTGIVYEATSRERMALHPHTSGPVNDRRRYQYLVALRLGRKPGPGRGFIYEPFEQCVLATVAQLRPHDVLPPDAQLDEREARIATLTARVVTLTQREHDIETQLADPDNANAVPALAKALNRLATDRAAASSELEALKMDSLTGRAEQLGETHSLLDLLQEAKGAPDEADLRRRVKAALRLVVNQIWVYVQPVTNRLRVVHVQIYLRSGQRRYIRIPTANLPGGFQPLDLSDSDFRTGHIPHAAADSRVSA